MKELLNTILKERKNVISTMNSKKKEIYEVEGGTDDVLCDVI